MKDNIMQNKNHSCTILIYGIILGIIYGFWMYKVDLPIWSVILVGVGFVLVAFIIVLIVYLKSKKDKQNKEENEISEVETKLE